MTLLGVSDDVDFSCAMEASMLRHKMMRPKSWDGTGTGLMFDQGFWWFWDGRDFSVYDSPGWIAAAGAIPWQIVEPRALAIEARI